MKKTFIRSYQILLAMLVAVMMLPQGVLAAELDEGLESISDVQYVQVAKTSNLPNIEKTVSGKNGITVYWDKVPKASRYYVYRKLEGNKVYKKIGTTAKLKFCDKTAKSGSTYRYVVRAKVSGKLGKYGKSTTGTRMFAPSASVKNSENKIEVTWKNVKGAKGYNIYRKAYGESKYSKIGSVSSGSTLSYSDKNVTSGKWYYYYVKAYNGKCESNAGVSAKTKYLKGLSFNAIFSTNSENIKVTWTPLKGADGYMVYYSTNRDLSSKVGIEMVGAKKDEVTIRELKAHTTYYISVVAYAKDNVGQKFYSVDGTIKSGKTGETLEEIVDTDAFVNIGGRKVWIGMSAQDLGPADEVLKSFDNDTSVYVYGTNDYKKFFAVNVLNGEVREITAVGTGFEFQGMKYGSSYKQFVCNDANAQILIDTNDSNIVHGLVITKRDYIGRNYSAESLAGESKLNFHCVNAFRVAHDLNILKWSKEAAKAAKLHSQDMADNNYFDHNSQDGRTPWERMREQGVNYSGAGENIAAGYTSGAAVYNGWVNSAGHRGNMLGGYQYLGVGGGYNANSYYRTYFTQDFFSGWN